MLPTIRIWESSFPPFFYQQIWTAGFLGREDFFLSPPSTPLSPNNGTAVSLVFSIPCWQLKLISINPRLYMLNNLEFFFDKTLFNARINILWWLVLKMQQVTWHSSPQAFLKEDTAIDQLVIFDDQLDASFIYCSPVLKLICLDQESVRGMP